VADSENSRTLPAITRRKLVYAPKALAVTTCMRVAGKASASMAIDQRDPVLRLFADWQATQGLCLHHSDFGWGAEVELFFAKPRSPRSKTVRPMAGPCMQ
jgi:hypothetical protein